MIIHLCKKFQSNTPVLSKDIAWKPKVLRTGRTERDGRTGRTYVRTAVILYAPPPPPGGGIKNNTKKRERMQKYTASLVT